MSLQVALESPEQVYRNYLETRGIPFTDLQARVCREVFAIHDHFTLAELALRLGGEITTESLERMVTHLIRSSLIRKVTLDERSEVYFEHIYGHAHHDHLFCVDCGSVVEFISETIEREQTSVAKKHGFEIVRHSLRIEGVCGACREKKIAVAAAVAVPKAPRPPRMPLTMLGAGQRARIVELACNKGPACRLMSMGLSEGDEIEVIQNAFSGAITVRHGDTRL
ncbi:MAG: transcriptional repressor, partial [Deltaproteobacteria bacterium]|nr:transcriptional repressor [Deltaproteobacteria bacterium]